MIGTQAIINNGAAASGRWVSSVGKPTYWVDGADGVPVAGRTVPPGEVDGATWRGGQGCLGGVVGIPGAGRPLAACGR
ncbi:hypothetical protein [Adlercreutzia equolifaciens]|uniref:hypothetical protein n=1 Tax=Adlercreutzia equolifaciens TaxID=446660 RepID=UPI003AB3AD8F